MKWFYENKSKGYNYLVVSQLTEDEIQEIQDCGYFIKKIENGYRISE